LRAKIGDNKEEVEERIDNTVEAEDDVSADFGHNPSGWHDISPISASDSSAIFAILPSSPSLT
jgi:hypothetical protein